MPKWTDYTIKTEPADNDEVMVLDTAGKANKRLGLSALSDWIIGKIANKVFENLQTQNKTILGAINELNSKALSEPVLLEKSQKVSLKCLNCLVLIISSNSDCYDLYSCIGYQSDSIRSLVKLIAGNGINKIDYPVENSKESIEGYYTITNGNAVNNAYIHRLRLTSLEWKGPGN